MKAAQLTLYGGKDALQINHNVSKPVPSSSQVLIAVDAAAVNPFDVKVREGFVRQMAELNFPATLGGDVAGIITDIGTDVSDFEKGQAVYGQANALGGQGSLAEYTAVETKQLAIKPKNIDFVAASALPLVSSSAYQALVDHIDLKPSQKILIHGGAGGIGSIAIQLAKHIGAHVATTAAAQDTSFVKKLGADKVIDYEQQDFAKLLKGYDAVYDTIGGETNRKSYTILKPGGSLVSMVDQPDPELIKKYNVRYTAQSTQVTTDHLTKIAGLVETGVLKPNVNKVFPLDQAAEAMEYLKTSHSRGKVVIQVKT